MPLFPLSSLFSKSGLNLVRDLAAEVGAASDLGAGVGNDLGAGAEPGEEPDPGLILPLAHIVGAVKATSARGAAKRGHLQVRLQAQARQRTILGRKMATEL